MGILSGFVKYKGIMKIAEVIMRMFRTRHTNTGPTRVR